MPEAGILTLLTITGIIGFVSLVIYAADKFSPKSEAVPFFCISGTLFLLLMQWYMVFAPEHTTQILTPYKIDNVVIVLTKDKEPQNMTKYFGQDIDVEKYNIEMKQINTDKIVGGIHWIRESPVYKLVKK
jgi:hypothetical protein